MTSDAAPTPSRPTDPFAPPPPPPPAATGRVSLPRPPGPVARALTDAWRARALPVPRWTAATTAAVGVAGGWVLVGHRPGLGAALLGAALWLPAAGALRGRRPVDLVSVALAVALVAVVAVRDAAWVVALCVLAAATVAVVAASSARTLLAHALAPLTAGFAAARALPWAAAAGARTAGAYRGRLRVALRSLAVTAVVLVVFGVLLASADQVFASYLRVDPGLLPARAAVAGAVALLALALAHLALAPPPWDGARLARPRTAGLGEWLLPVVALDALLLGFVGVQVAAALGGHAYVRATTGLTYAEYARSGFWQLLAVTALTVLVVALAARRAPRATRRESVAVRAALGVLCLATLAVVASALRRMDLYVDAYGLTRLRVLVVAVEIGLAAVLVLMLVAGVRWRGGWVPRASLHVGAATVLALALLDPDAMIARHNTSPDFTGVRDVMYLRGLSADAVPVLAGLDEPARSCALLGRVAEPPAGALDWNLGRARAADALARGGPAEPRCSAP